jgi:hypothetical protein
MHYIVNRKKKDYTEKQANIMDAKNIQYACYIDKRHSFFFKIQ